MNQSYERQSFHWTYVPLALLSPWIALMWAANYLDPDTDTKSFKGAFKAIFNRHTHSYAKRHISDTTKYATYYQCDNLDCNLVHPETRSKS